MSGEDDAPIPIAGRPAPPPASHWHAHAGEQLCICFQTPARVVIDAIRQGGLRTVAEVAAACQAGGACGSCRADILELLEDERAGRGAGQGGGDRPGG